MKKAFLSILFFIISGQALAANQDLVILRCTNSAQETFDTAITAEEYRLIISGQPLNWPLAKTKIYADKQTSSVKLVTELDGNEKLYNCSPVK